MDKGRKREKKSWEVERGKNVALGKYQRDVTCSRSHSIEEIPEKQLIPFQSLVNDDAAAVGPVSRQ